MEAIPLEHKKMERGTRGRGAEGVPGRSDPVLLRGAARTAQFCIPGAKRRCSYSPARPPAKAQGIASRAATPISHVAAFPYLRLCTLMPHIWVFSSRRFHNTPPYGAKGPEYELLESRITRVLAAIL